MTIFFALVGIVILGLGIVAVLLLSDKKGRGLSSKPLSPQELANEFSTKAMAGKPLPQRLPVMGYSSPAKQSKPPTLPMSASRPVAPKPPKSQSKLFSFKFGFGKKSKPLNPLNIDDFPAPAEKPKSLFSNLINKFPLGTSASPEDLKIPKPTPLPNLKDVLELEKIKNKKGEGAGGAISAPPAPTMGTAALSVKLIPPPPALSKEEEKSLQTHIDISLQLTELKTKYEKINMLLTEKNIELDKTKIALENELKNRKEFNKVKDLLEKEIKDTKDRARDVQNELGNTQSESDSFKKRIHQLEEKVTNLEQEIVQKEEMLEQVAQKKAALNQNPPVPVPMPQAATMGRAQSPAPSQPAAPVNPVPPSELPAQSIPAEPASENPEATKPLTNPSTEAEKFLKLNPDIVSETPNPPGAEPPQPTTPEPTKE